jgi:hypothetical protein
MMEVQEEDMTITVGIVLCGLGALAVRALVGDDGLIRRFLLCGLGRRAAVAPVQSLLWLFVFMVVSGCATQQQFLDQIQPTALGAASSRAQFELNCPTVTTSILSRKIIQPVWAGGIERAEYTIGVEGCGKRSVYMAVCPEAGDCNAFAQTARIVE